MIILLFDSNYSTLPTNSRRIPVNIIVVPSDNVRKQEDTNPRECIRKTRIRESENPRTRENGGWERMVRENIARELSIYTSYF